MFPSRFISLIALAAVPFAVLACRSPEPRIKIVSQLEATENSCGPASILNTLAFAGGDLSGSYDAIPGKGALGKIRHILAEYGSRESVSYDKGVRYRKTGIACEDVTRIFNDILGVYGAVRVKGEFLNRDEGEPQLAHLRRIHEKYRKSIEGGLPVITSFRSFAPEYDKEKRKWLWEGLFQHFVTVISVQEGLAEEEKGFRFSYIDSYTERIEHGYIHVEEARNFTAAKGNVEKWEWLKDHPFLLVASPSLRLKIQEQPWYVRTIITLNYGIFRAGS